MRRECVRAHVRVGAFTYVDDIPVCCAHCSLGIISDGIFHLFHPSAGDPEG